MAFGGWNLSTSVAYFNFTSEAAQTFTVGITGTLTEVDLFAYRFSGSIGDLIVDIRGTQANGLPTTGAGQELLTTTVPASSVSGSGPGFLAVDLSSFNFHVTAGESLAVVIHVAPDPNADVTYWWGGRTDNQYANGFMTVRDNGTGGWVVFDTNWDLGFKTWVNSSQQPPVVTLPGGPVDYTGGDPPIVLSPTATVTDADSPDFDTGTLTVSLAANGTVDDRIGIRNQGTGAGQIGVSGNTVTYAGTPIGTFSGGVGTTPLTVNLNASATPATTQALVRNLTFSDVSSNPSTADRTVQVVLTDGDGGTSDPATITVKVHQGNQPPTVTTNNGLTVSEGGSGVVSKGSLETTDPDNSPDQLTYSVSSGPSHGTLQIGGNPVTTFTQADINAGILSYVNDGNDYTSDSFIFTVSDGQLSTTATTFNITINAVDEPPKVMTNAGLVVVRGSSTVIGHAALDTADPDTTSSHLVYTISGGPSHGLLELGPQSVTTFTQADLDAGRISYVNDGNAATTDAFTFVVSDGTNSTVAETFAIAVDTVPQVTLSPSDTSAFVGSPVILTAAATGITAPTVQWQVKAPGGAFVDIPGATSTTNSFLPTASDDGSQYRAVFTNRVGTATSAAANLTLTPGLAILTEPVSQTTPIGGSAIFTAAATGSTRPIVQWQVSTDGGATYTNIRGATKTTLSVKKVSAALDGALYRAVFRNSSGQAPTAVATLTVNYTVTLAGKQAVAVRPGTEMTFAVQSKSAPSAVQWQMSADRGHSWANIAGATTVTYKITAAASDSGNLFRALVTINGRNATSPAATLTVLDAPAITLAPTDQTVGIGQTAAFAANSSTSGAKLQWQVSTDGGRTFTVISGATQPILTLKKVTSAMSGYLYRAVFTDAVGVTESVAAKLTVT